MYCHVCGAKSRPGEAVCSGCSTKLLTSVEHNAIRELAASETAASIQTGKNGQQATVRPQAKRGSAFTWLIPLLLVGVVSLALMVFYKYETQVNEQVEAQHQQADIEATAGRYAAALQLLDSATVKRPHYQALRLDREIVAEAVVLQEQLAEAAEGLKTQKLQASEESMKAVADSLMKREEPVFAVLKQELVAGQMKLTVMKVKSELDKLNTVAALGEKLDSISKLEGQEVTAVKAQIINKLVGVSYAEAEKMLGNKDFTGALKAVDKGLSFASDNDKLSDFRERILSEKVSFEKAEQERIELAEQQAAQEDLNNRTAAIEVTDISVFLDDYGDLEISGTVSNTATRPIYSINLNLAVYDAVGSYLGETYASVSPYRLESGENGGFTASYYGVYEQAQVSVVNATWYLE